MQRAIEANVEAQLARLDGFRVLLEGIFRNASAQASSSDRLTLLFESVLKVTQSANAVQMLCTAGCVEEVLAISRTLVEVTVNAAYFQFAQDKEVDRFIHFHPETEFKQAGLLGAPRPRGFVAGFARRLSDAVSGVTGPRQGESAWSSKPLVARARFADEQSDIPVMVSLVARCFSRGAAAAHGTIGSLDTFIASVHTQQAPRIDNRMAELTEALFGVNLCLLTLCTYLNAFFHVDLEDAIDEAANAEELRRTPTLEAGEPSEPRRLGKNY